MATNFKLKRSSVANKRPGLTNLELGELALNTYDGFLFTERNGLGITTVTNLTPWYENYGAGSIFYSNKVGIGTTAVPDTNQLLVKGGTETDRLNVTGVSTFLGVSTFNEDVTFTTANGNNIVFDKSDNQLEFGSDVKAEFGANGQLEINFQSNTGNSSIQHTAGAGYLVLSGNNVDLRSTTANHVYLRANYNKSVDLYYNNTKRFATSGVGATVFGELDVTGPADIEGNLTVGVGGTTITTVVGAAASVGIGDASPSYMLDVAGAINSQTDVKINGVSVTEQALNDAVAMAIALG